RLNTDSYDARRYRSVAFTIGNYGYVVSGRSSSGVVSTVWKYDPSNKSWSDGSESLGSAREKAVGFSLNGVGYITTGVSGTSYLDDTWEFRPVRRSEERRVGKECRSRGSRRHEKRSSTAVEAAAGRSQAQRNAE